jgi:hypothetical protein
LHKASNLKFPFIIGPFIVKSRSCLSQVQEKLKEFGFAQLQGRRYDPDQIISNRRLMNKHAPYEHEQVEGFDKLSNLEVCVDMEETLQQIQTQQAPHKMIIKVSKISVYNKRSSLEAMGISDQQTSPKKMKVTQPTQIVDLEEEEPRDQVNIFMVESGTSTIEVEKENKIQSEGSSRTFSSKKYIFDKNNMLRRETHLWVR